MAILSDRELEQLLMRIDKAIKRITNGEGLMRVPADQTDPDLVLADCRNALVAADQELARLKAEPSATDRERAQALVKRINAALEGGERFRVGKWVARWADLDTREQTIAGLIAAEFAAIRASQQVAAADAIIEAVLPHAGLILNRDKDEWECFCGQGLGGYCIPYEERRKLTSLDSELSLARVVHRDHIRDALKGKYSLADASGERK
jgi:hypothetical protein